MIIKNKFKSIRHTYEMSQIEFAAALGVNKTLYNKWERQNGQPSLERGFMISYILDKPFEELFDVEFDESELMELSGLKTLLSM